jgi:hypothetical protein
MTDKPFGLKWTTDPIESLGIFICNDFEKMSKLNQQVILDKMDKQINFYKNIKMNLSSKIFILNTKIISQVVYRATSMYIEPAVIKQMKTKIVDFF